MTKSKKEPLEGFDVCMYLHTALRKSCDSSITSAAYNLIHMIDFQPRKFDPWWAYGNIVARLIQNKKKPLEAAKAAVELLDREFCDVRNKARDAGEGFPDGCMQAMHALKCTLECFDANDWAGFVSYLE